VKNQWAGAMQNCNDDQVQKDSEAPDDMTLRKKALVQCQVALTICAKYLEDFGQSRHQYQIIRFDGTCRGVGASTI